MKHPHNKINTVRINIYVIKLQERTVSLIQPTYYQQYGEREIFSEINLIEDFLDDKEGNILKTLKFTFHFQISALLTSSIFAIYVFALV